MKFSSKLRWKQTKNLNLRFWSKSVSFCGQSFKIAFCILKSEPGNTGDVSNSKRHHLLWTSFVPPHLIKTWLLQRVHPIYQSYGNSRRFEVNCNLTASHGRVLGYHLDNVDHLTVHWTTFTWLHVRSSPAPLIFIRANSIRLFSPSVDFGISSAKIKYWSNSSVYPAFFWNNVGSVRYFY